MQPPRLYSSLWLCAGLMGLFTCVNAAGYMDHTGSKRWHAPHVSPADHYGTVDTQHLLTFQPFSDLRALSDVEFTTLEHPLFPRHSVRVKKSQFCDGNASAYTGYIDVEARHLFFYFFESRRDAANDDVIFWTNGGPGGSSSIGLFFELGPCRLENTDNTTYNPYSWNEKANIFFIDQPIGVGFSYADHGEYVSTTEEAARDITAFVSIFFEHFSQFKGNGFHMSGESYGGRYIPVFASEVYDQNARLAAHGLTPINLTSVMIGNGCTDDATMFPAYYDMQCKNISAPPVLDISACVTMKRGLSRCEKWFMNECINRRDDINCAAALSYCNDAILMPFAQSGMNPYDITKPCAGGKTFESLCYTEFDLLEPFLNKPDVRKQLGIDPSFGNFSSVSFEVGRNFDATLDEAFPTQYYLAALLERGVRVLLYVGANDWICNWVGNERMARELEWTGQQDFVRQSLRDWTVDGKVAGITRGANGFTFATVQGAGHMVPFDKPKESLELVQRWLAGLDL